MTIEQPGEDVVTTGRLRQFRAGLGPAGLLALLVLAGLAAAQNFDSAAFGVLAPQIRHTFHLDNAGIDSVSALTGAIPLLLSVVIGNLGDRGNRIRISRYSAFLWGVTAILTGLAPVLAVLVVARLLGGVGLLSSQTIYPSLLSDYYPEEKRAQVFTVFLIGSTGIGLAASPFAGYLGDAIGWRSTFVLLALPTFVFAFLLRLLHEPTKRPPVDAVAIYTTGADAPDGVVATPTIEVGNIRESFRKIRTIRTLRRTWLAVFILGGAAAPLSTLVSTYFKDVFHVTSFGRGLIISAVGVGGIVGLVLAGTVAGRMLERNQGHQLPYITGVSAVIFAIFLLVVAAAPTLWIAVVAAALAGIGLGGFFPPYTTIVSMVTPSHLRSQAYAWTTVFLALGAIAVATFVGTLADAAGQRVAIGVLAPVIVLGGLVLVSTSRFVSAETVESNPSDAAGPGMPGMFG